MTESRKERILALACEYAAEVHKSFAPTDEKEFIPGKTPIPYAGRVFGAEEVTAAVGAALDFWLTLGKEGEAFSKQLAAKLGVRASVLVNSGSSANLLALSALTSPTLPVEKRLCKGDEVITCAAGFPTTVAPIVQNGLVPVFIDNDPVTANPRVEYLEEAYVPGKTKAVIFAHALGNPFNIREVVLFCKKHDLFLIEDNCDALGSVYFTEENPAGGQTGSWGDLSTQSFYPPHHITLGEGGAVNIVSSPRLERLVESFRDWGRDCWCDSGKDNTCGKRFLWSLGELPAGYDHKYIYSHLGYNLKPLDIQAAIGKVQLQRLSDFVRTRQRNWTHLRKGLDSLNNYFEFSLPTHATSWNGTNFDWDNTGSKVECSWFGFLLLVSEHAPFSRAEFASYLESKKIHSRMFFGGNLVKQPAFVQLAKNDPKAFRVVGELSGADTIMNRAIFIGVYPGLTLQMLDYVVEQIHNYIKEKA